MKKYLRDNAANLPCLALVIGAWLLLGGCSTYHVRLGKGIIYIDGHRTIITETDASIPISAVGH